ncbi:MAG: helix-turn-helix domain-containing protein [Vulcanococcus sp.]
MLIEAPSQQQLIERADRYIAAHYREALRMPELARHCHVSVRTLQNLFVRQRGESPLKAIRRYRLRQLHAQVAARPQLPLRQHYVNCGLIGSTADRALFQEFYGHSVREHQLASRSRLQPTRMKEPASTASPSPQAA